MVNLTGPVPQVILNEIAEKRHVSLSRSVSPEQKVPAEQRPTPSINNQLEPEFPDKPEERQEQLGKLVVVQSIERENIQRLQNKLRTEQSKMTIKNEKMQRLDKIKEQQQR